MTFLQTVKRQAKEMVLTHPGSKLESLPLWFKVVALIALFLRGLLFFRYLHSPFLDGLLLDAQSYWDWAGSIAHGSWVPKAVFQQGPLYPYVLGALRAAMPALTPASVAAAQLFLNWLTCLLFYPLLLRAGHRKVALLTAVMAFFYAPAVFLSLKILAVTFSLFLLQAGLLFLTGKPGRNRWRSVAAGIFLGAACLSSPQLLLAVAVLFIAPVLLLKKDAASWKTMLAAVAGFTLTIAPVTVQNYLQDGSLILISANYGLTFYQGNNPSAHGSYAVVPGVSPDILHQAADAVSLAQLETGRRLNAGGVERHFLRKGFSFIIQTPGRFSLLLGKKIVLLLGGRDLPLEYFSVYERRDHLPILWFFPLGGTIVLFLTCLSLTNGSFLRLIRFPFLLVAVSQGLVCLIFYISGRYALPFHFYLLPAAAWGVFHFPKVLKGLLSVSAGPVILAGAVVLSCSIWNPTDESVYLAGLAAAYEEKGELDRAVETFKRALDLDPDDPIVLAELGRVYAQAGGDPEAALELCRRSLRINPDNHRVRIRIAQIHKDQGRLHEAVAVLQPAVAQNPFHASLRLLMGDLYLEMGETAKALEEIENAVQLEPRMGGAHYLRSVLLRREGRTEEVSKELRRALELDPLLAGAHNDVAVDEYFSGNYAAAHAHMSRAIELGYPVDPGFKEALRQALGGTKER